MSDELTDQIADLRQQVADLQRDRVTYRVAEVTATDPVSSTFTATLPDGGDLAGVPAPAQFLPNVGDSVRLTLVGATPIYEPERIAEGAVTVNELDPAYVFLVEMQAQSAENNAQGYALAQVAGTKWVTVFEAADTYTQTVTGSLVSLTSMSGSVVVPTGRQLEVEAYLPLVEANSGGGVFPRLLINSVGKASAVVFGGTSAIDVPVTLSGTFTGTGASVSFGAAVYGIGTFGKVRAANDGAAPGPRLRYRII